jgi:hypothetical protein
MGKLLPRRGSGGFLIEWRDSTCGRARFAMEAGIRVAHSDTKPSQLALRGLTGPRLLVQDHSTGVTPLVRPNLPYPDHRASVRGRRAGGSGVRRRLRAVDSGRAGCGANRRSVRVRCLGGRVPEAWEPTGGSAKRGIDAGRAS